MTQLQPANFNSRNGLPPRPLSVVLHELAGLDCPITVAGLRDALGDRGFAALLMVFAAINLLPLPPGTSLVLGIPLLIVSAQMALGRTTAWLPRFVLNKSIGKKQIANLSKRLTPKIEMLERFVQPRLWPFSRSAADRWIGWISFIMALAVTIPVPFGNWTPALSIAILGIALSERDGVLLTAGILVGLFSLGIIGGMIGAAASLASLVGG
jgi:hypothetical protein